ncbi:hypothetical protein RclHR1_00160039 [Rhizophagus clarus]|uniref:Uncharacterized protein n=1 Tax=Rhizophagus clarus TaxID=94130 RepID=A0A2Z6QGL3_9GLOM|nr:hypothetical protein RclHR1_00160039 [Rhizophagus clarus]
MKWNRRENALKKRRTGRGGRILILRKRRKSSMLKAHPSDSYVEESKKISVIIVVEDITKPQDRKIWNTVEKERESSQGKIEREIGREQDANLMF